MTEAGYLVRNEDHAEDVDDIPRLIDPAGKSRTSSMDGINPLVKRPFAAVFEEFDRLPIGRKLFVARRLGRRQFLR